MSSASTPLLHAGPLSSWCPLGMDRRTEPYLHGGYTDHSYTFPEDSRVYLLFIFQSGVLFLVTNALLDIAYIRRRWRLGLMFSRLAGLMCSVLFIAWPQPFFFVGLGLAFNFGFCDPRLHLASIRRSPESIHWRVIDVLASCGHHTGASQITGIVLTQICIAHSSALAGGSDGFYEGSAVNIFNLDIFLLGAFTAEVLDWGVDCAVLLRVAPRWFAVVQPVMMSIQAGCFLAVILLVKSPVPRFLLFATAFANILLVVRIGVMGNRASTHEHFDLAGDEVTVRGTIARHLHGAKLLSRGDNHLSIAPVGKGGCLIV